MLDDLLEKGVIKLPEPKKELKRWEGLLIPNTIVIIGW